MKHPESLAAARRDPLGIDAKLPLHGTYHPAGFLLHVATNSQHVLDAARESWSHCPQQIYPSDAIGFRVVVEPAGDLAADAIHRAQGPLYSVVSDAHNCAALDLRTLSGSIFVSERTAADHLRMRWLFVESLAYMLLAQRYVVPVHAACVALEGAGILLAGPSQAGKSTLSYACAREGWSYVSDDAVFLLPDDAHIAIGRHNQFRFRVDAPQLFPELQGFLSRARPNGKVAIEIPVTELPHVTTSASAPIAAVVLLERHEGLAPELERITGDHLLQPMLEDMPSYGPLVNEMHERTVRRLLDLPAYRLRYSDLGSALQCLRQITAATH